MNHFQRDGTLWQRQDCLSVWEVKGRFERSQETCGDDVFVDEVGETHHAVFTSPQFHEFGEDDEAGFLSDGIGEVHGSLDDGENNSLDVLDRKSVV